jgi:cation diffusion facilitator CzcD-associated flavoprotein CzcO
MDNYDVVIIGSGWSGLCSLKHCLEEKLNAIILEKSPYFGGVWNI